MEKATITLVDRLHFKDPDAFFPEEAIIKKINAEFFQHDLLRTEEDLLLHVSRSDMLLCTGNPPVTKKVMEQANCSFIIRYGIGVNTVDLAAATELGIVVFNMPGFCTEELSMQTAGLILDCLRNISLQSARMRMGEYPKAEGILPRRLSGLTIGLFGFGASAKRVAEIFNKGFHSKIIAYSPSLNENIASQHQVEKVSFEELIARSDILSIHASLNNATRHIFNTQVFQKMKNSAIIINTARGSIICEKDLINSLQEGEILGAGLDVSEIEPMELDNPLRKMENVVLTPHSGYHGKESTEDQHKTAASLIEHVFTMNTIVSANVANKDVLQNINNFIIN